jgi:hypothetical protein
MTDRRDLKQRIRERQARTGERYATARLHTLSAIAPPSWVIELRDVSTLAKRAGIACAVRVAPSLQLPRPKTIEILTQLKRIVVAAPSGLGPIQRAVLQGQEAPGPVVTQALEVIRQTRIFLEALRSGLRGPGVGGRMLAFDAELDGARRTLLAWLVLRYGGEPILVLSELHDGHATLESPGLWTIMLPQPRVVGR